MSRSNIPKPNDKGKIWIGLDYLITFPNNFYLKSKIKVSFSKKESRTLIITMNGKFYQQLFSNFPPKLKRNVSFLVTSVKPSFSWNLVEDILGSSHTWDQEGLACVPLSFPWCNGWWPGFCKACGFSLRSIETSVRELPAAFSALHLTKPKSRCWRLSLPFKWLLGRTGIHALVMTLHVLNFYGLSTEYLADPHVLTNL